MRIVSAGPSPICTGQVAVAPSTLTEGITRIERLLARTPLCQHDAQGIKGTYRAMKELEGHLDLIPPSNTLVALRKINEKVSQMSENPSPEGLVSLVHLQGLSDLGLPMQVYLDKASRKLGNNKAVEIAQGLPKCCSEEELDKDVNALIGGNPSQEVKEVVDKKKKAILKAKQKREDIDKAKARLQTLKKDMPKNYPGYFDELLELGCNQLCTHLMDMSSASDPEQVKNNMTFSQISQVILETRNVIIQRVESSIPDGCRVLLLIGNTGSGKSTTLRMLAGDKMRKNAESAFDSLGAKSDLIGQNARKSCTFLPNIEIVQGVAAVDFPGFVDTNGLIIALGILCALIALAKKYNTQIFVIESIMNFEGKYVQTRKLGEHLQRLFLKPRETLTLGITKYAMLPAQKEIQAIEDNQRRELSTKSDQERDLEADIRSLTRRNKAEDQKEIQEITERLQALKQAREQMAHLPLPDTPDKLVQKAIRKAKEDDLKGEIGLSEIIQLDNLEDPGCLDTCLKKIFKGAEKKVQLIPQHELDPATEKFLIARFEENLAKGIQKGDIVVKFKEPEVFEREVYESSLTKTIFSESDPEIGDFVHLAEIDSGFAQKLDEKIVDTCITKYMDATVGAVNEKFMNRMLLEINGKTPQNKVEELDKSWKRLKTYMQGLLGLPVNDDPKAADEQWKQISEKRKATLDIVEERFNFSTGAIVGLCIPAGIPYGLFQLYRIFELKKAAQASLDEVVVQCRKDLDQMYESLQRLELLKRIIKDKKRINDELNFNPISTVSFPDLEKSMRVRIGAVQKIYGGDNWDRRVEVLAAKIGLTNFDPRNSVHRNYLLTIAYSHLESDLFPLSQSQQGFMGIDGLEFKTIKKVGDQHTLTEEEEELRHLEQKKAANWLVGWAEYLEAKSKGNTLVCGAAIDQTDFIRVSKNWAKVWLPKKGQDVFSQLSDVLKKLEGLSPDERTNAVYFISKRLNFKQLLPGMECFKFRIYGPENSVDLIGRTKFPELEVPNLPYKNALTKTLQAAAILQVLDKSTPK